MSARPEGETVDPENLCSFWKHLFSEAPDDQGQGILGDRVLPTRVCFIAKVIGAEIDVFVDQLEKRRIVSREFR